MTYSCSVIAHNKIIQTELDSSAAQKQHWDIELSSFITWDKFSPFTSHGAFKRWSPFMGCCSRDLRPVIELRCPPVREPAGWVQLPNWGLAPAGRSGVGSWESCLDILDQTGLQEKHLGRLKGRGQLIGVSTNRVLDDWSWVYRRGREREIVLRSVHAESSNRCNAITSVSTELMTQVIIHSKNVS